MEIILKIDTSENNAFFLWGARKTGKTTYLIWELLGRFGECWLFKREVQRFLLRSAASE